MYARAVNAVLQLQAASKGEASGYKLALEQAWKAAGDLEKELDNAREAHAIEVAKLIQELAEKKKDLLLYQSAIVRLYSLVLQAFTMRNGLQPVSHMSVARVM